MFDRLTSVLILVLAGLGLSCSTGRVSAGEPGDQRIEIQVGARTRSFLLHVPAKLVAPVPLVIAFHGGGGNASGYQKSTGLDRVADRAGFAVAYPDGTGKRTGSRRFLTWNAGDCCGAAQQQDSDDVGFTLALIDESAERLPIDRDRIYATGHSNGAMMTYRVAAEAAERFAAVAPVAGSMNVARFAPAGPVAVLHIHSVDDPRAPYRGGLNQTGRFVIPHRDVEAQLERWRTNNLCQQTRELLEERKWQGHTAALYAWRDCAQGHEVALWKLTGAGHGWPGGRRQLPERIVGPETHVIDASEEVWAFFERFRRAASTDTGPR